MTLPLFLAALGLGIGALDLTGIVNLPHGLGIAALAFGVLLILLMIKIVATMIRVIAGMIVLALAAMAIFGAGVFHHLF